MRIKLEAANRVEAQRIVKTYVEGGRRQEWDDAVLDEVWRLGRTPSGNPRCVGATNGTPTYLMFDVDVYPEITG